MEEGREKEACGKVCMEHRGKAPKAGHGHLLGSDKQMSTSFLILFLWQSPRDWDCVGEPLSGATGYVSVAFAPMTLDW